MKIIFRILVAVLFLVGVSRADLVTSASVLWGDVLEYGDTVFGGAYAENSNGYVEFDSGTMTLGSYQATAAVSASYSSISLALSYLAQDTLYDDQRVGGSGSFTDTFWIVGPSGPASINFKTTILTESGTPNPHTHIGGLEILVDGGSEYLVQFGVPFVVTFKVDQFLVIGPGLTSADVAYFGMKAIFNAILVSGHSADEYRIYSQSGVVYPAIPEPSTLIMVGIGLLAGLRAVRGQRGGCPSG